MTIPHRFTTASPAPVVEIPPVERPEVSFVVVTYGTGGLLVDALDAARRAGELAGVRIEVVVVDNPHPTEPSRSGRFLRLDTRGVTVVEPATNVGFGGGCELGILHTSGEVICLVNPDVAGDGDWLGPLLGTVAHPDVSIVAPVLVNPDGSIQEAGQRILPTGWTRSDVGPVGDTPFDVDFASAACWVMRRDEHERLGGFDPVFHPAYFEDADLAFRARRLGGRVVVHGGARVTHVSGGGSPDAPDPVAQHDRFLERWPEVRWRQSIS